MFPDAGLVVTCRDVKSDKCEDVIRFDDWYFACIFDMGHDGPHRDEIECDGKSVIIEWRANEKEE